MNIYKNKYLKYKEKYLNFKSKNGSKKLNAKARPFKPKSRPLTLPPHDFNKEINKIIQTINPQPLKLKDNYKEYTYICSFIDSSINSLFKPEIIVQENNIIKLKTNIDSSIKIYYIYRDVYNLLYTIINGVPYFLNLFYIKEYVSKKFVSKEYPSKEGNKYYFIINNKNYFVYQKEFKVKGVSIFKNYIEYNGNKIYNLTPDYKDGYLKYILNIFIINNECYDVFTEKIISKSGINFQNYIIYNGNDVVVTPDYKDGYLKYILNIYVPVPKNFFIEEKEEKEYIIINESIRELILKQYVDHNLILRELDNFMLVSLNIAQRDKIDISKYPPINQWKAYTNIHSRENNNIVKKINIIIENIRLSYIGSIYSEEVYSEEVIEEKVFYDICNKFKKMILAIPIYSKSDKTYSYSRELDKKEEIKTEIKKQIDEVKKSTKIPYNIFDKSRIVLKIENDIDYKIRIRRILNNLHSMLSKITKPIFICLQEICPLNIFTNVFNESILHKNGYKIISQKPVVSYRDTNPNIYIYIYTILNNIKKHKSNSILIYKNFDGKNITIFPESKYKASSSIIYENLSTIDKIIYSNIQNSDYLKKIKKEEFPNKKRIAGYEFKIDGKNYKLINIHLYWPDRKITMLNDLKDIVDEEKGNIIIVGDINLKYTSDEDIIKFKNIFKNCFVVFYITPDGSTLDILLIKENKSTTS